MSVYKNDDADFLKIALESIYEKQTLKPDEIVIVFDGLLTDKLYRTVEEFTRDKVDIVKLVKLEKNSGLGEALRIGSEQCSGEFILRMDSDDISDSLRFEKQIAYVSKNPEVDVLGAEISEFKNRTDEDMRVRVVPTNHADIVCMGKRRNPMNHVTACIKKSALERSGGYETLLLLEDYYLWIKMIVAGCVLANLSESLVYVRVGNGFNSKRGSKARITGWTVLQDYMLEHHIITRREALMNKLNIRGFVYMPAGIKNMLYNIVLRK
jgi:glycosyltransferase involved in cell wall biosynthesis